MSLTDFIISLSDPTYKDKLFLEKEGINLAQIALKRDIMYKYICIFFLLTLLSAASLSAQKLELSDSTALHAKAGASQLQPPKDTFPHVLPFLLPTDLFIPTERLFGFTPWTSAPLMRPTVRYTPIHGFNGSIGFGEYELQHPDKFFSTLEGYNSINIPHIFLTRQMILGNTFRLGRNVYYLSGIMYGTQMGVMGNNWGMGTREGFMWNPNSLVSIVIWTQAFQSVTVYTPVIVPDKSGSGAAIVMPATPEVFSFGVQANFVSGEFIIGIGTSVAPVPFQKRKHSELRR